MNIHSPQPANHLPLIDISRSRSRTRTRTRTKTRTRTWTRSDQRFRNRSSSSSSLSPSLRTDNAAVGIAATEDEEIHQRRSTSVGTGTGIGTATTSENEDDFPYFGYWDGEGERERERDRGARRALLTAGRDGVEGGDEEVENGARGRERRKAGGREKRVTESGRRQWMADLKAGKLGDLLRSPAGWRAYVGGLVVWLGGCQFGLLLMNRFILWTGVYKFPYPLTATLLQLMITHALFNFCAATTRFFARQLVNAGLAVTIAPFYPDYKSAGLPGLRGGRGNISVIPLRYLYSVWSSAGGIAGGGFFEFDGRIAREVLPLAVVFMGKVILSNLSFAYAVLPVYMLARIGVIPLSLLLSKVLLRASFTVSTLSSTLTAVLNLLIASCRSGMRVTWESIVAGIFSSLFVALFPILIFRTYKHLVACHAAHGNDLLANFTVPAGEEGAGNRRDGRAFWRIIHYTSLLSILMLTPIVILSGELGNIARNCYFLDVVFFWFLVFCGAVGSCAVFLSTVLLVVATASPLTVTFVSVPRSAVQLALLSKFKMPAHSWVGVVMCLVSSLWFMIAREEEGVRGSRY